MNQEFAQPTRCDFIKASGLALPVAVSHFSTIAAQAPIKPTASQGYFDTGTWLSIAMGDLSWLTIPGEVISDPVRRFRSEAL